MIKNLSLVFAVALLAGAPLVAQPSSAADARREAPPFPHEQSDLKPDPEVRFGKLANGVRYAVRPNKEPNGRVSLRLLVLAGSLHEAEDQRGVAHFLEHLAFNGSEHYPPGTLVEFFQRMGMSFGGDTNANTGHERTVYLLELAKADEATIAEGLRVLRDYAGGLLLLPQEIEKERQVILSERRARDAVGYRTFVAQFEAMLGSTLLPKRLPIGTPEVISNAGRERFTDFWNTWYRPERMAVVAVGDFGDATAIEKMIREAFAGLEPRAAPRDEPKLGELPKFDGIRPVYHYEPEAPSTEVSITRLTPHGPEEDTAARRIERLPRWLALSILNRRFSILAKKENAPLISARASVSEQFDFYRHASVSASCQPATWQAALGVIEQELRSALEFGFTAGELKEAVADMTNSLEQAVKTAPTRRSPNLADAIVHGLVDGNVFTTPAAELELFKPALEKVTPQDCVEALRAAFAGGGQFVSVTGNMKLEGEPLAAIAAAYENSQRVAVSGPANTDDGEWAYSDFGPAGAIEKRERVEDLGIELVTFANGARLNIKKTDFEAGRIGVHARIGVGSITEPADQRGLSALAGSTFTAGGLGKHSVDDLRRILAGRNVGVQFRPEADALVFSGATTPEDLALQLQLLGAFVTDAGYRPEALRQARKGIEQLYASFQHTPNGPLATEVANLLANGDPRFGMPPKEVMLSRNLDEVKAWLAPQLAQGALELALVGDLDVESAITAAARTIGALPKREPKPELPHLKKVTFPEKPFAKDYTFESEIPKGQLQLYWPSTDGREAARQRRLSMLASVFNDRLRVKVREEIGATYSPRAGSNASDIFPGYGYFSSSVDVDPPTAAKIADLIISVADDLANNGVTDEELNRAKQPALTAIQESMRTNGYWLTAVLARAQEKPQVLEWARTRFADVQSITAAELSQLAGEYLDRERASRATVLPSAPPK
jgi:zinc protease